MKLHKLEIKLTRGARLPTTPKTNDKF